MLVVTVIMPTLVRVLRLVVCLRLIGLRPFKQWARECHERQMAGICATAVWKVLNVYVLCSTA